MQVKVTGKNLDVGEALRTHIESRLMQFREKYFEGAVHGQVMVAKQRSAFSTDCSLHLATGLVLQSHASAQDALASFEAAAQHLEKQLKKYKQRLKSHQRDRRDPVRQEMASDYTIAAASESDEADAGGELNPVIIAEHETSVPELTVGEAVMALEISSVPFVLFRNSKGGRTSVVYRRSDGNIGWVEPKTAA
jgi:ribosomal subunit interface protein